MDIELIHVGLDGFDVAFDAQISRELSSILRNKKKQAQDDNGDVLVSFNGLDFHVTRTGKEGGYAFTCNTGLTGELWWFKEHRPDAKRGETWGVFVSVRAIRCQMQGLERLRLHLIERLNAFGIEYINGIESINRIDLAADMLIPGFVLDKDHFVMGHRFSRSERGEGTSEWAENGAGRRTTYLRIGQSRSRAIAIYDKRKDIIEQRDKKWIEDVWNRFRAKEAKPLIDVNELPIGSIWRFECRWGKRGLSRPRENRTTPTTTFGKLSLSLKSMCQELLEDIRMVEPVDGIERWQCPVAPIWVHLREAVQTVDVNEGVEFTEDEALEKAREEKAAMYLNYIAGCTISMAGLYGVQPRHLLAYAPTVFERIISLYRSDMGRATSKLEKALERYGYAPQDNSSGTIS